MIKNVILFNFCISINENVVLMLKFASLMTFSVQKDHHLCHISVCLTIHGKMCNEFIAGILSKIVLENYTRKVTSLSCCYFSIK